MCLGNVSTFTLVDSLILTALLALSAYLLAASSSTIFSMWLIATLALIIALLVLIAFQAAFRRMKRLQGVIGVAHIVLSAATLGDAAVGLWLVSDCNCMVEGFHFAVITLSTLIVLLQMFRMATLFAAFVLLRSQTVQRYAIIPVPGEIEMRLSFSEIQEEDVPGGAEPSLVESSPTESLKSNSVEELGTSARASVAEELYRVNSSV